MCVRRRKAIPPLTPDPASGRVAGRARQPLPANDSVRAASISTRRGGVPAYWGRFDLRRTIRRLARPWFGLPEPPLAKAPGWLDPV